MKRKIYEVEALRFGRHQKTHYIKYTSPKMKFEGNARVINSNHHNITLMPIGVPFMLITLYFDDCENKKEVRVKNTKEEIIIFKTVKEATVKNPEEKISTFGTFKKIRHKNYKRETIKTDEEEIIIPEELE